MALGETMNLERRGEVSSGTAKDADIHDLVWLRFQSEAVPRLEPRVQGTTLVY